MIKYIILFLCLIYSYTNAQTLDVFVLDSLKKNGINIKYIRSITNSNSSIYMVNSHNKDFTTYIKNNSIISNLRKIYATNKISADNDIAYTLYSIQRAVDPTKYKRINLYFINSIFYKDKNFDFTKGFPSDGFLTRDDSPFYSLPKFHKKNIYAYIYTDNSYFLDNFHKDGLERFYYLLFKRLGIHLVAFNGNFSDKQQKFNYVKSNIKENPLAIINKPLQNLKYHKDKVVVTNNKGNLKLKLINTDRKNTNLSIQVNNANYLVMCDESGICELKTHLKYGKNKIRFIKLDGSDYNKEVISNYLPDDEIAYKKVGKNIVFTVNKSYRKIGDIVKLENRYNNKSKIYKTFVSKDRNYSFIVPLQQGINTMRIYQKNGNVQEYTFESNKPIDTNKSYVVSDGNNTVQGNTEKLVNSYQNYELTKEKYIFNLNKPSYIDKFVITEFDGDFESVEIKNNTFNIFLFNKAGERKTLILNEPASGNQVSKTHDIKNPYPTFKVSKIVLEPNDDLGPADGQGFEWAIEDAYVVYKEN